MKKTVAILVNYNNSSDTIEAVKSLQKQTLPFEKILIVDNNSTDSSLSALHNEFVSNEIQILHSKANNGFAAGNNLGIRYALKNLDFDYFLIINNDTISDKNLNEKFVEYYEKENSNIGILSGKILNYYQPDKFLSAGGYFDKLKCSGYHIADGEVDTGQHDNAKECSFLSACLWFFHKDLISEVGYLPEEYFLYLEDVDYCLQVQKAGYKLVYIPSAKILHKEGATTKVTKKNPNFYYTNRNRIICSKKHLNLFERINFLLFFFTSRIIRFFQYLIQSKFINTFIGISEGFRFEHKKSKKTERVGKKYILKFVIYSINLPIYALSSLIKKNRDIWIFGAWYGKNYSDNSKYLFQYINSNKSDIKAIWLSRNSDIINQLRMKGFIAYNTFSFWGYYYSMRAKVAIVSHSVFSDLNYFAISPKTKIIQLWHGIPLKKIYYDDTKSANKFSGKSKLKTIIFPFLKENFDLLIVTSAEFQKIAEQAFMIPNEKIKITGYPRNDVFFRTKTRHNKKKIIYLPTLRKSIGSEVDLFSKYAFDADKMSEMLKNSNSELYIKLHPVNKIPKKFVDLIRNYSNIIILENIDIYDHLNDFDLLITDFSSVYFDFLLSNKPIIFATFDKAEYLQNERELYFNYDDVTPGEKAKDWIDIIDLIPKAMQTEDSFIIERKMLINRFFKHKDNHSSQRVFDEIMNLINRS